MSGLKTRKRTGGVRFTGLFGFLVIWNDLYVTGMLVRFRVRCLLIIVIVDVQNCSYLFSVPLCFAGAVNQIGQA